jgi:hypothetical protein
MREFERIRSDGAGTDASEQWFPADFSDDEAVFASELRGAFPLEQEILPPYYVQALVENDLQAPTPPGFEQKLTYDVFHRLNLPRSPLFPQQRRAPWQDVRRAFTSRTRSLAVSLAAVAALMVFSVIIASPSFAAGLQLLLAHTGVQQVSHYPENVHSPTPAKQSQDLTKLSPTIPVYWLGPKVGKYAFSGGRLLAPQNWSDGPIINLQYVLTAEHGGTGVLDIREFKIAPDLAQVLQEVQAGSATWLNVNGTPAVYVDGIWTNHGGAVHQQPLLNVPFWQSGIRSELMIEENGIVIWIVGDQRDGANRETLAKLAEELSQTNNRILFPNLLTLHGLGESFLHIFQQPEGHEVYRLVPQGAAVASNTGIIVASDDIQY